MAHEPDSRGFFNYRILGLDPEKPSGHRFQSRVEDLDLQPDLWAQECPYRFPDLTPVDILKEEEAPRVNSQ